MEEDFDVQSSGGFFDFKGFLFRLVSFWWLFLISLAIAFGIARYINVRKVPIYRETSVISIKDDQNQMFGGNTSLVFNWGGTTDKVQTSIIMLKSRSHAERVVQYLQYYINYQKQGEYHIEDVYGNTPFRLKLNDSFPQLYGKRMTFIDQGNGLVRIKIPFNGENISLYNYRTLQPAIIPGPTESFDEVLKIGDTIETPFLKGVLLPTEVYPQEGDAYLVSLGNFNATAGRYRGIGITQTPRGSSILELSLVGTNKKRLIDYLNASIAVRTDEQLRQKNLFATKTIKYIDSSLKSSNRDLDKALADLNYFQSKNRDVALSGGAEQISSELQSLDNKKDELARQLVYYKQLENYLTTRTDYTNVPAPSVTLINEGSITNGVSSIVQLALQRSNLSYTAKEGNPAFRDLDRRINAEKEVLFENIRSSKEQINYQIATLNQDIREAQGQLRQFPKEEQELAEIQRRFSISQEAYDLYTTKRSEAEIIKASNVSDILFIDKAKDVGRGPIGPNTQLNKVMAAFFGSVIPIALVLILFFLDAKIGTPEDVKKRSSINILGVIGKNKRGSVLVVRDHPRSAIAEAFRGLRSSLQFIYKKKGLTGAKTVLVTSSISGEGKTFTSINLASVFALSEKKTVLVGLDLRKPKIFDDFNIDNDKGVVNYLIGDAAIKEIKQPSGIPHLDVILSGPIPPNPSELIISGAMEEFVAELKEQYDYIIFDTPPLGLVSDAFELMPYADASLYIVRQGYTKKDMLRLVNDKYEKGEIKNISFVLNYFQQKKKYGYGYSYGYGAYNNGYHEEEKSGIFHRLRSVLTKRK
ncbi:exopolysaccharide transport family protein [Dokdonia sp. Hel_I_53]|uniref:exopolysaccharide transport family protein n=1 Tax=Dokdonia sp. Hel_I_53 TaxID=1566287 RepID=UPI00119973C7|nr:polysaccharide biosynthesis tyrosine autokinase [Dokdonia sp. Hel_I_53]TVZ53379.1 protein involved in gliding motility EpsB [Dokdonia sp. Hel_I_53]